MIATINIRQFMLINVSIKLVIYEMMSVKSED